MNGLGWMAFIAEGVESGKFEPFWVFGAKERTNKRQADGRMAKVALIRYLARSQQCAK